MTDHTMTHAERARRWLQTALSASLDNLKAEHLEILEDQLEAHERAYPDVRDHAIAGAAADFDQPLSAELRSYQQHLRQQDQLDGHDVLQLRRELRAREHPPEPCTHVQPRRRRRARAGELVLAFGAGDLIGAATGRRTTAGVLAAGGLVALLVITMLVQIAIHIWPVLLAAAIAWPLRHRIYNCMQHACRKLAHR